MSGRTSVIALLLAVLMVGSVLAVPAVATDSTGDGPPSAVDSQQAPETPAENESADTIYVTEDGDLVLAYREDDDFDAGRVGLNVSEGLVHLLVENETDSNVTGALQATLARDEFVGNGSMAVERPEAVKTMDLQASAVQTDEQSSASVSLDATVENESAGATAGAASLSTEGRVHVAPDRYEFSASLTADGAEQVDTEGNYAVAIAETDTGYDLEVDRVDTVSEWVKSRWDTRENATRTLEAQYNATAEMLGGTSEVTLESYEFTETDEGTYRLVVEYAVEYRDVHEGVADQLTRMLADQENLTLSESEAEAIAEKIDAVEVETIEVAVATSGTRATMEATVDLGNTDELASAVLDVAAAAKNLTDDEREQIERARERLAAQQASGVTRTVTWSGSMAADEAEATVQFEMNAETTNWAAHVDELQSRDIEFAETEMRLRAETVDGEIETEVSATVREEDLLAGLLQPGAASATDSEQAETLRKLREAGFRRAKLNASLSEGSVTLRAAANFENMSALQDAMDDSYDGDVTAIVGRMDGEESVTYVRVTDAVGADPSRSDVRALSVADEDTTIKMPGEWNRTFPAMDVQSVRAYLGYDTPTASPGAVGNATDTSTATGTTDAGVPGFGVGIALVALLAAAVVGARRSGRN
ncbi:MAG: PGF-CTERM sorting domain-containing protein [Halobacteriales archaeon]